MVDSPVPNRFTVDRTDDQTLTVSLVGDWDTRSGIGSLDDLEREMDGKSEIRSVQFDADQLRTWDSSLLTFLLVCHELCTARTIEFRDSGLPKGVRKLLELARAVPPKTDTRSDEEPPGPVTRLGADVISMGTGAVAFLGFTGETVLSIMRLVRGRAQLPWSHTLTILQRAGPSALGIVLLINFLVGMILAFVGAVQLTQFGAAIFVADLVAIATVREMGCMMTAIIMSGRTGAAFAAELGTMSVNQEIDALKTFGISPIDFLVLPRVLALFIMMPILTVFANIIAIFGGFLVSILLLDLNPTEYLHRSVESISLNGFLLGVFKGAFFGILIGLAGCFFGIRSGRNASSVGQAATSAVVAGITAIIVADGLFAVLTHLLGI